MMQIGPREGEVRAANEIFTLLPEGHDLAVIIDALAGRNGLSDKARSELASRIRKLRIKGFRDANRAPHDRLVETILDTIARRRPRARRGHPRNLDADPFGPAGTGRRAPAGTRHRRRRRAARAVHQLLGHRRVAARTQPDAAGQRRRLCAPRRCRADAELGVRPVSRPPAGRIRALQALWIDTLWELPASAPEWPADRGQPGQVDPLHPAREGTGDHRRCRPQVADQWNGIENEFNDDLHYLGIGPITLQAPPGGPELLIGTLEFLTALRVQLEAYRPLRPQAASRQEEIERSEARRAAEEGILKLTVLAGSTFRVCSLIPPSPWRRSSSHSVERPVQAAERRSSCAIIPASPIAHAGSPMDSVLLSSLRVAYHRRPGICCVCAVLVRVLRRTVAFATSCAILPFQRSTCPVSPS